MSTFSSRRWPAPGRSGIPPNGRGVPRLAAAYAFGLVRNHPYRDGNKRIGFLTMATFLELNGYDFVATDAEIVTGFLALAAGAVTEDELATWVVRHSRRRSGRR